MAGAGAAVVVCAGAAWTAGTGAAQHIWLAHAGVVVVDVFNSLIIVICSVQLSLWKLAGVRPALSS